MSYFMSFYIKAYVRYVPTIYVGIFAKAKVNKFRCKTFAISEVVIGL